MSQTRRRLLTAAAGASGVAVAAQLAERYGLKPPDGGGLWGPGATLSYAAHRLMGAHALAREFSRGQISQPSYQNGKAPADPAYARHQAEDFANWQLAVDGLVARPGTFSLAELKGFPVRSQITQLACEEGWSFIAEWTGVPLAHVLKLAGVSPQAKFVVFHSIEAEWWDTLDLDEATHPQTLLAYRINGDPLPPGHGGPLRLRVPRQLGYKSLKFLTRVTVAERAPGLGSGAPAAGYSWYAGI